MSTSTYNVRSKPGDGTVPKNGPIKATIPMSSFLRPLNGGNGGNRGRTSASSDGSPSGTISTNLFATLSPPMRHISPNHQSCGHRSPCAANYYTSCKLASADKAHLSSSIRRTASLDALYMRPSWNVAHHLQSQPANEVRFNSDKATQTEGIYVADIDDGNIDIYLNVCDVSPNSDHKKSKVLRDRLQGTSSRTSEHSVSSQTLSPVHAKASPVTIPIRPYPTHPKPMRNSVEGLNQEIEKLVLLPGQPHTCRPESNLFSRGIPEGHRAPLADMLHADTRSVNTQTPNRDHLSSDGSQSTSPEEGAISCVASPSNRINRFLAREPPDGCEKVCLKLTDADQIAQPSAVYKPSVGFKLIPSRGSAFQPLQPFVTTPSSEDDTINN